VITDQLQPNLMFRNGVEVTRGEPLAGDGSELIETPYIYVFDARSLTDATSPRNLSVPIEPSSDFALRRIFGLSTVASQIQIKKASQQWSSDRPFRMQDNHAVVPEETYPADSFIQFDLTTVLRSFLVCGGNPIYTSFLYFQGAKRFLRSTKPYETPYRWKQLPYAYNYTLNLNWSYYVNPLVGPPANAPRTQYLEVKNYDFELHEIEVCLSTGTIDTVSRFMMTLYDYSGKKTSSMPIAINYINDSSTFNGVFPVPPLLYPANSQIQFDITSLLCNPSLIYSIKFVGKQRYPLATE